MPRIQVDSSCIVEGDYGLPSSHIENLYAEPCDPRYGWQWRLVPTPGLAAFSDYTSGTLGRGCFQSDAIASGSIISVYTTDVRKTDAAGATSVITGSVTNDSKPIAYALSQTQAVLNSGGDVYTVTASAVTDFTANLVSAGASGEIIDVAVVNNRHLFAEDNSGRVFYSDPGDATTIGGFFTAERDPDQIKALLVVGSNLLAMGSKKTEVWTGTDSATVPFIQRQGMVFEYGVIGSRARCQIASAAYWASHDHKVIRWAGGAPENIAPFWLTRMISRLSAANKALVRLTAHSWGGNDFVKVYVPGQGSFFFNATNGALHRRRDLGDELVVDWSYDYFVEAFGGTFCQILDTGQLFQLDNTAFTENDVSVRRVCSLMLRLDKPLPITNLIVEGQAGVGLDASGVDEDDNPQIMLRTSTDGHTFGDELTAEIGRKGAYRHRAVFGSQGTLPPPLFKVELAYSAAVGYTIYGLTYNEQAY